MTLRHRATLSNYPHLSGEPRPSSEYEMLTSRLSYEPDRGFELELPVGAWHARHRPRSQLLSDPHEAFSDPRQTTYASYVERQHRRELAIDALHQRIEESDYEHRLPARAKEHLDRAVFPLRYLFHGFQMIAAYLGELAPNSRVAIAAMFQAADELRRIQRIAQRLALSRRAHPELGADSRAIFEGAPEWQPARKLIEELLATYDFDEAFTALNLSAKPIFDELILVGAAGTAKSAGDPMLEEIFLLLREDALWQREWSLAFARSALEKNAEARRDLPAMIDRHLARAAVAAEPLSEHFGGGEYCAQIVESWRARLREEGA